LPWQFLFFNSIVQESAKDEYKIPALVEDLVLLDFTDIEKALYKDAEGNEGASMIFDNKTTHGHTRVALEQQGDSS
jgi:hypothetical protein